MPRDPSDEARADEEPSAPEDAAPSDEPASGEEASNEPAASEEASDEAAPGEEAAPVETPSRLRRTAASVRGWFVWIRETYCQMDPRTAGVYRFVAGFLATAHAIRHWQEARRFYSNEGVLSNHYHLFKPSSGTNLSLFHSFSTLGEVHVAFALAVICHVLMMIGFRARLFTVLSFIIVTSLDNRLVMVENGGYVVVNLVLFYGMFLPVERRFSVDALVRSYRERKERTVSDLNDRVRPAWATERYVSFAVLLVVLNLAIVYFFNCVNKSGTIWRKGETVHYVLHINRMVTGLAVLVRSITPMWASRVMTWSVLIVEALLVTWILAPYGRRITRPLALAGIFGLHMSFGLMMRLGPFSWFMIGWSMCLIAPEQWDALERWHRRRAAPRVIVYDRTSPLAFAWMRLLSRLDGMHLLTFEEGDPDAAGLVVVKDASDPERSFTGRDALREIAQALPGGRLWFPVLRVATLGQLDAIYRAASARRAGLARFFGLAIPPRGVERPEHVPSPIRASLGWFGVRVREIALAYFAFCSVLQAIDENKAIPPEIVVNRWGRSWQLWSKPTKPRFVDATLGYPRMYQGWGMFAPNPITDDGSVSIDARTIDGRRLDPFTGEAPDLDISDAQGLGLTQVRQDYFNRIRLDRNKVYRQGLLEYLKRWHHETGRPEDELVAFDVYWVRAQCPKPYEKKAYRNETIALLTYRKPGYKPAPGLPPLPPEPKIESAESKSVPETLQTHQQPQQPQQPQQSQTR